MPTSDTSLPPAFATLAERPVFLFCKDSSLAESLAADLRHQGLRVRSFVNLEVLRNAASSERPFALVVDVAAIADSPEPLSLFAEQQPALLFIGPAAFEQRLQAVRAGGSGYFPHPINRSALLHRLMALASAAHSTAGRVLLIDGPERNLRTTAQALEAAGLQLCYLEAPERTLALLEQEQFDLLLLSDSLTGMRGSELLQVVRQNWRFHPLPAVLLTQADKRDLDAEATAAGADAVLGLPVATEDLLAVLQARRARAQQLLEMYRYSTRREPDSGLFNRDYFLTTLQNGEQPTAAQAPAANAWTKTVREALCDGRFRLVYQPIASLSGQPCSYYEVFIRMLAEDGRDILPQEFLAAAATAGLGEALDRWVLARAVDVLESQRNLRDQPILFVKLLPESIASGAGLIDWLADRIRAAELDPARLVLQVRQECASTQPLETRQFVAAARALGCLVALEHYAVSGESGQRLLQELRPEFVRLAAQLTQDIGSNVEHQRQVEMIAGQCRAVGAKPIAALVQDALHLSVLWRCGVEYIQGYFMQEPADVFAAGETLPAH